MCLAVPLKLEQRDDVQGIGEFDGVRRRVRLDFVPAAKLGDYVIVHAGFAIEVMDPAEAQADRTAFLEVTRAADALASARPRKETP